jgi:alpha-D-ribose 1-methylphosphonate 5-triphosphate synthase subunit PhnG
MSRPEITTDTTRRRETLGLLARAPATRLAQLFPDLPPHDILRAPEIGTVMIRGRAGGTGSAFNLGEMTVTRASIRLSEGQIGHGYVQGRDKSHALRAATIDALAQDDFAGIDSLVLQPLRADEAARKSALAAEAAATKVEFFTLVRGEDQ